MHILFCSAPVVSLFTIKPYAEPNVGAGMVAGGLETAGHTVDYYDLNAMLSKFRFKKEIRDFLNDSPLDKDCFKTLTTVQGLNDYLNETVVPEKVKIWADKIVNKLVNDLKTPPDILAVSMERRLHSYYQVYGTLNFLIILRKHLENFLPDDTPFYVGGSYAIDLLHDHEYILQVIEKIDNKKYLPHVFFRGPGQTGFSDYIDKNWQKDKQSNERGLISKIKSVPDVAKPVPKLIPNNKQDGEVIPIVYFPKEISDQFPELKTVNPFNFYNWKFSDGCIFKCSFCYSGMSDYFKHDNTDYVVDCMAKFQDQGVEFVRFFNDNFNFKIKWVNDFCNKMVQRNIKIGWSDSANMRIGDADMFKAMADAGCVKLWYGTETVSDRLLKIVRKEVKQERILQVLEWANAAGIWNSCNFIFNFPTETEEEFQELKNFILTNRQKGIINGYSLNAFLLLPGTEYLIYPERFGIEVQHLEPKTRKYVFNEINGRSWEELQVEEQRKYDEFFAAGLSKADYYVNDYLTFALHKLHPRDIAKKTEIYNALIEYDRTHNNKFYKIINKMNSHNNLYKNMFHELYPKKSAASLSAAKEDHIDKDFSVKSTGVLSS